MVDFQAILDTGMQWLIAYSPAIVLALVLLVVGFWIINLIASGIGKQMAKKKIDESLRHFLLSLIRISLKILLIITIISTFGVEMTSFVAVIGAATLAIGLALQGSLSNFAGGVLILFFKPYKVGDFIEAQGHSGTVSQIQIFNTILKTPDNKTIIIPNGPLSNGSIVNYSEEKNRRVDMTFGIGYSDDIKKARKVIEGIIAEDKRILKDPEHQIIVSELADSSVNFAVRVWCDGADYWGVFFDMQESVKEAFDKNKITIPFPQRDVHHINQ